MSAPPIPIYRGSPDEEVTKGAQHYGETLRRIHATLEPEVYVEIGIRHGHSLALSNSRITIGIDPVPDLKAQLASHVQTIWKTSDDFFAADAKTAISEPIQFAFIDGMHLFEFALRDFIHIERLASRQGVVVFDDVFPNHPTQASRDRRSSVWTGDVWKIVPCLRKYRPDLRLFLLDTSPTGLLLVADLDPENRTLSDRYDEIVSGELRTSNAVVSDVLLRENALDPRDENLFDYLARLRSRRHGSSVIAQAIETP